LKKNKNGGEGGLAGSASLCGGEDDFNLIVFLSLLFLFLSACQISIGWNFYYIMIMS